MRGRVATTAALVALGIGAALSTLPASATGGTSDPVTGTPLTAGARLAPSPDRPTLADLDPRSVPGVVPLATPSAAPPATPAAPPTPPPPRPTPRRGVIYLTFDDGPRPDATPLVLQILRQHGAHATFFLMGSRAHRYPALVDAVRAGGHAIGNHTWSHPDLTAVSTPRIRREISSTAAVIGPTRCFRAPYGSTSPRVERAISTAGLHHYLWDVDTADWMRPSTRVIVERVLQRAQPGAVVLMHDGGGDRSRTVEAVRRLVPALIRAGYDLRALPGC